MESEKNVEHYLCQLVRGLEGEGYKFVSPMRRFVLDRLCVLPYGITWFVEVKSEGQKPHPGQLREIARLTAKGHKAVWVDSVAGVNKIISQMREEIDNAKRGRNSRCITEYYEPYSENELPAEE
jgi:hypothetical protein